MYTQRHPRLYCSRVFFGGRGRRCEAKTRAGSAPATSTVGQRWACHCRALRKPLPASGPGVGESLGFTCLVVSVQSRDAHGLEQLVVEVTSRGDGLVGDEDFLYAPDDEERFDTTDFVLFFKGEADPNAGFGDVRSRTGIAVLRCESRSGKFTFAVRVIRAGLVGLRQEIRMQGVDRKPLVGLDVVVGMARHRQGPHDEPEQGRSAGADMNEGAENSQVLGAPVAFGADKVNTTGPREGVHEMTAVHGFLGEDVLKRQMHSGEFGQQTVRNIDGSAARGVAYHPSPWLRDERGRRGDIQGARQALARVAGTSRAIPALTDVKTSGNDRFCFDNKTVFRLRNCTFAFRKQYDMKQLAILCLLAGIIFACGGGEDMPSEKPMAKKEEKKEINAKKIWKIRCIACHGVNGDMGTNGAANLQESTRSLEYRINIIKNGSENGVMNAFGSILSDEEIEAMAKYTMAFNKDL